MLLSCPLNRTTSGSSDAYDLVMPYAPLVTFKSRATTPLFLFILFTTLPLVLLPLRLVMVTAGLAMFTITHPLVRHMLFDPAGLLQQSRLVPYIREGLRQLINDVSLSEKHIASGGSYLPSLRDSPAHECEQNSKRSAYIKMSAGHHRHPRRSAYAMETLYKPAGKTA